MAAADNHNSRHFYLTLKAALQATRLVKFFSPLIQRFFVAFATEK